MIFNFDYTDPKPLSDGVFKTDFFHKKPLFEIENKLNPDKSLIVKSWEEAFSLHDEVSIEDVNLDFIAALLMGENSLSISPYKRIRRLSRSSSYTIKNGSISSFYHIDPFQTRSKKMPFEKFCEFFEEKITNNIISSFQNKRPLICAEHSSGVDSNSILGILIKKLNLPADRIFTWTMETPSEMELIKEFREFYKINPINCLTPKNQNNESLHTTKERISIIEKLGAPLLIDTESFPYPVLKDLDCKLLFSGLGGDQALSHHGINIQNDLAKQWRLKELTNWTKDNYKSLKILLRNNFFLLFPNYYSSTLKKNKKSAKINTYLTAKGKEIVNNRDFQINYSEGDFYSGIKDSIKSRISASWITVRSEQESRLAKSFGIKKIFPLLDEELICEFMNQDPTYFSDNKESGRKVMRMSMSNYLPPYLINNPSKKRDFDYQELLKKIEKKNKKLLEAHLQSSNSWNKYLNKYVNINLIKNKTSEFIINDTEITKLVEMRNYVERLCYISDWFNILER